MRNQLYFFFWQFLVAKNKQTDFVAGRGESLLVHFSSAINHKMLQTSRLCGGGIYSMTKLDFEGGCTLSYNAICIGHSCALPYDIT